MTFIYLPNSYDQPFIGPELPRLEAISRADSEDLRQPRIMHMHDDRIELLFVSSGSCQNIICHRPYQVRAGDLLVYNARIMHEEHIDLDPDTVIYTLDVRSVQRPGMPSNHLIAPDDSPLLRLEDYQEEIHFWIEAIYKQASTEADAGYDIANHLTRALLSLIVSEHRPVDTDERDLIAQGKLIKQWLDEHYAEEVSLQDIADALYLSPFHISRVCKRFTGYAPMHYVNRRRIGEAQTRLINSDQAVTDLALDLGFSNPSVFHRSFKQLVGCSPGTYRKNWQQ